MIPPEYDLLAPMAAGPDGVSYRAKRCSDGRPVEVRLLGPAREDPLHWGRLAQRLRRARLLDQPGARRVLELDLDAHPPLLVLDWVEGSPLDEALAGKFPLSTSEALAYACFLAAIVHAAHRLGLTHGTLAPRQVLASFHPLLVVDFTGTAMQPGRQRVPASNQDTFTADVGGLAGIIAWLATGTLPEPGSPLPEGLPPALASLLQDMLGPEVDRPTASSVETRLREVFHLLEDHDNLATTRLEGVSGTSGSQLVPHSPVEQLGRYRLLEKLGQGGMGEVFRALDTAEGRIVAIKTLLPEHTTKPHMLQRFLKEARMLEEVNNPHVANLLEVNVDGGMHYLVVEFVEGKNSGELLEANERLEERHALAILADVSRGLATAHERNIVHRDIKPENILLLADPEVGGQVAKLSDFGLARHIVETESLHLTRTGAILGTPLYLSPEQCRGDPVDPRSDIYSAGATLFHFLVGRPPFLGDNPMAVLQQHCQAPIPALSSLRPDLSEGVCRLVEKALAKLPAHRHAHAGEFLQDIERLLRGEPTPFETHPRLPDTDSARILTYQFRWDLESTPTELWPFVSNTERLNRAISLSAVQWTTKPDETGRVRREGMFRKFGVEARWEEHPFEWVEGRRFGVLRELQGGPFRWLISEVELEARAEGGTTLTHRIRVEPRGVLGRTLAAVEIGVKTRRALERVYRRIDRIRCGREGTRADHFEEPKARTHSQQLALDEGLNRLARRGVPRQVIDHLGQFLATAPPQELARIRPLTLARRLGLEGEAVVGACLHGAREGLLILLWDLLCPLCRIPSEITDTLRVLKNHGRCEACNLDYDLDFSRSVELIFRADPSIADTDLGVFCIGGPAHSPHVVAQLRVAAKERLELNLNLQPGSYRLRGPQLPAALDTCVEPGPHPVRWEVELGQQASTEGPYRLRSGGQVVALRNPHDQEILVRLERAAGRDDALTAARAATLALFRKLFPGEVLSPGRLVSISRVTLLASELAHLADIAASEGEGRAFAVLHAHLEEVEAQARRQGGTLVKALGDGALAAFSEPVAALRTLLALEAGQEAGRRLALHRGPALAATINDHLDYFGAAVRQTLALLGQVPPGEQWISQTVLDEPQTLALLLERGLAVEVRRLAVPGQEELVVHRLR